MKRIKSGFTLAEVLITLGVIGVIAAIVMPSVMTNYTYKTVGVKLSKFQAQLEQATRAHVAQGDVFTSDKSIVADFVDQSFIITNGPFEVEVVDCSVEKPDATKCGSNKSKNFEYYSYVQSSRPMVAKVTTGEPVGTRLNTTMDILKLKDGTEIQPYILSQYDENPSAHHTNLIEVDRVGEVMFGITYNPNVQGLPKAVNQAYNFVVTETGYVYPDLTDACMMDIFDSNFQSKAATFKAGGNCSAAAKK